MSERLHLDLGGEPFETTPENTTLFTFLGQTAVNGIMLDNQAFNHIFFQKGDIDDSTVSGAYMFRTPKNADTWDTIAAYIASNDFPMVLNRRDVPACDITAYHNMVEQVASNEVVEDFIPEDWLDEGQH